MAGSKRSKLKQAFAPQNTSSSPPTMNDDDELINDLMAQLDSRNQTVHSESATVLNEIQLNKVAGLESQQKQDAKSRFKARQVGDVFN